MIPCRHCGGKDIVLKTLETTSGVQYYYQCSDCEAESPNAFDSEKALEYWHNYVKKEIPWTPKPSSTK